MGFIYFENLETFCVVDIIYLYSRYQRDFENFGRLITAAGHVPDSVQINQYVIYDFMGVA